MRLVGVLCVLACVPACGVESPSRQPSYSISSPGGGVEPTGAAKQWRSRLAQDWQSAQKRTPGLPDMDDSVLKNIVERMTLDALGEWTISDKRRASELKGRSELFERDP